MATPDQRKQIFDFLPGELAQFQAGKPVSAAHLNTVVDVVNKNRAGVGAAEQVIRTIKGGSISFAIVRGWADPVKDVLDVSIISRNAETGTWLIVAEATVEVSCSPGLVAGDYESVRWVGAGTESYPLSLPRQITVLAQPVVSAGGGRVAMWLPSLVVADPLPGNLPVSDGYVSDGASEVSFAIAP